MSENEQMGFDGEPNEAAWQAYMKKKAAQHVADCLNAFQGDLIKARQER